NDGSEQDSAAGGREPVEVEDRAFSSWLWHDRRDSQYKFVETVDRDLRRRKSIEQRLGLWQSPGEDHHAQNYPGQPGLENFGFGLSDFEIRIANFGIHRRFQFLLLANCD